MLGRVLMTWSTLAAMLTLIAMMTLPFIAGRVAAKGKAALSDLSSQTGEVVNVVEDTEHALLKTARTLDASALTLDQAQTNLQDIQPLLDSLHVLLGEEAPDTIIAMQAGLESAQSGARAMDQVLRVLSSLRFLTGVRYDPEQPLDSALQGISESLTPMPPALISVSDDIETFGTTLEGIEPGIGQTIRATEGMSDSLRTLSSSLSGPRGELESLSESLELQAQRFERRVLIGVLVSEILLLQFALLQFTSGYVGSLLLDKQPGMVEEQ